MLYLIMGPPGTGKTTLAKSLWDGGVVDRIVHTDVYKNLPWSEQSAAVAAIINEYDARISDVAIEGAAVSRGLRKFIANFAQENSLYAARFIVLRNGVCDRFNETALKAFDTVIRMCLKSESIPQDTLEKLSDSFISAGGVP